MKKAAKDGHTLAENRQTQPLTVHRAFNRCDVLTEGWYPLLPARKLKAGQAQSVVVGHQRLVVFRGQDRRARVLDAFCPHMGADLANGRVVDNQIECYFHQWRFDGTGTCTATRCGERPSRGARLQSYPVAERLGFVWAYAGERARHEFPVPPGLEGKELVYRNLGRVRLYAHHHAMMAGGIDTQHFASVHDLDVSFDVAIDDHEDGVADWRLQGVLPAKGWRARWGGRLIGRRFGYALRVAGGSIAAIRYGEDQRFLGRGRPLPSLYILWGCLPKPEGVSEVEVFLLAEKGESLGGRLRSYARIAMTMGLLGILKDDDIKAFPHMRFNPRYLLKSDASVARFIQYANALPISPWSRPVVDLPLQTATEKEGASC